MSWWLAANVVGYHDLRQAKEGHRHSDVTERLTRTGGYIFAAAHAVEGDVPRENMLAFIEVAQGQEGYRPPGPAG